MRRSILLRSLALGTCSSLALTACERAGEPKRTDAKLVAVPATQPSAEQLADMRALVDASAPQPAPANGLPPGHPPVDATSGGMPPAPAAERTLAYDAPDEWEREPVRSAMRSDQFRLPAVNEEETDGELVVYYFGPGGGGGVEANLERWTGQFSLADGSPIPNEQILRDVLETNGLRITTLDVAGRYQAGAMHMGGTAPPPAGSYRLLAAIVEGPNGPWFIKATGPAATMTEHRDAFVAFLRSMNVK